MKRLGPESRGAGRPSAVLRASTGPAILVAAAGLASYPLFTHGASCGHDFDFHLVSWLEVLRGWREGILYPHWAASPNYGAGEPRFVFYPPLTWMLGAALGAVMSWDSVPAVMTLLLLAATGFATRGLARQALSEGAATLAGCLAIFSGYPLYTAYERTAYAELTGGFWIPLLLLLLLRESDSVPGAAPASRLRRALDGSALLLALAVAGAWLSNAPLGVMASYLVAAVALTRSILARSWAPILRAVAGMVLGLGLCAFYLLPAAWEQRWVAIAQAVDDPGTRIENSFLFARHANPLLEQHDLELLKVSAIAVVMVALALLGILVAWRRRSLPGSRRWWIPLALIPIAVLLLQLPVSLPVWNALPKLRFLQFPWRWLVVVQAPLAIFLAAALWCSALWKRALVVVACVLLCVAITGMTLISFFQGCDQDDSIHGSLKAFRTGAGFAGTDEYAPQGTDNSIVATDLPAACLVRDPRLALGAGDPDLTPQWAPDQGSCTATFAFARPWRALHRTIRDTMPQAGFLVLHLRRYPAWEIRVNGIRIGHLPDREDGLIAVPVPAGPVEVAVDWVTTPDVRLGRWISGISLALVAALGAAELRRLRPRLS